MKTTDLASFESALRTTPELPLLYLLVTPDPYDGELALAMVRRALGVELTRLDGEKVAAGQLTEAFESGSLFGERSALLIRSIEKLRKPLRERVEQFCAAPAPGLYLILMSEALPPTSPLIQGVAQRGMVLLLPSEKPWARERQLLDWIRSEGRSLGKELSAETARLLLHRLGQDKFALRGELEKLSCYVGDRPHIGLQDVEGMTAQVAEVPIWELGKAIVHADLPGAISLAGRLIKQGAPLVLLMAHLRSQFQTGLQICSIREGGGGMAEIGAQLPNLTGKRLEIVVEEAGQYGAAKYRRALLAVQEAERLSRSVGVEDRLVLERLILRIVK